MCFLKKNKKKNVRLDEDGFRITGGHQPTESPPKGKPGYVAGLTDEQSRLLEAMRRQVSWLTNVYIEMRRDQKLMLLKIEKMERQLEELKNGKDR